MTVIVTTKPQNSFVSDVVVFTVALCVKFPVQTFLWLQPPTKRLKTEEGGAGESRSEDDKAQEPCLLRDLQKREITAKHGAAFWPEGWREKLCKCGHCMVSSPSPLSLSALCFS